MRGEKDGIDTEIALQWNDAYAETIYSFANNINTHEGGHPPLGLPLALTAHVNSYAAKNNLAKDLKDADDQRRRHPRRTDRRHQRQDPRRSSRADKTKLATPRSRGSSRRSSTTSWARSSSRTRTSPSASS
jgi:DNA gyrase/topoisomerase IV subunit B